MDEAPEIIPFKSTPTTDLHLHVFRAEANGVRPALVFFFGGGWMTGSVSQFFPQAQRLAERGVHAFCAEYRVRSRDGVSPIECVMDGRSAIRYVREHATALDVDTDAIVAAGGSAGAHVAACCAMADGVDDPSDNRTVPVDPCATVLFNPVLDTSPDGLHSDLLGQRYREISPLERVREGLPPSLIMLGREDRLIPVSMAEGFRDACVAAGNVCELELYDGAEHGFFNHRDGDNPFYAQTLTRMERFLEGLIDLRSATADA